MGREGREEGSKGRISPQDSGPALANSQVMTMRRKQGGPAVSVHKWGSSRQQRDSQAP